jgi:hypothetical protein
LFGVEAVDEELRAELKWFANAAINCGCVIILSLTPVSITG